MGLFINTNTYANTAQRNLLSSSHKLGKSFQRLSSGLRVNSSADDAAGMSISERFNSQIRGLTQGIRNANDSISLVQVAEGALQESTAVLQRMRELAVQAASDVNTAADRRAIQLEIAQLNDELQRIGDTTTFNQQKLLDGTFNDKFFHIGMNFQERVAVRIRDARSETIGRVASQIGGPVDTNVLDGDNLAINQVSIRATVLSDDQISTTLRASSAIAKSEAINDSTEFTGVSAYVTETRRGASGEITGGVLDESNYNMINDRIFTGFRVETGDADESLIDAINADLELTGVYAERDSNGEILLSAADGRNIDVQAVGNADAITGLSTGVTTAGIRLISDNQFQLTGTNEVGVGFGDDAIVAVTVANSVKSLNVETREGANDALLILDRAISQISSDRSELGAIQNRMQSTIANLASVTENAAAAKSRILDADFAAESAGLARNQILTQAATTILAQANQVPQQALSLLQ
ncbi:MAG: flagellin [Myxococcota bacterium]|nr:flagellin [Myxococcota bacterium]